MSLILERPAPKHKQDWAIIIEELKQTDGTCTPYSLESECTTYEAYLERTEQSAAGKNLNGFVSADTYFLTDGGAPRILGAINIRHQLNDYLYHYGGHIGYGIRPGERRKGYAKKMLAMALDRCRELEMKKVLITCNADNPASAGTILANGGVLENELLNPDGVLVQRYWITL